MNKNTSLVKRVLCAWVSLCMVLTLMVPAPVFATASHAEGVGEQSAQPVQTEDARNKDKGSVPEDAVSEDATPAPEDAAPAQEDAAQVQEDRKGMRRTAGELLRLSVLFSLAVALFLFICADALGMLIYDSREAGRYLRILAPLVPVIYTDMSVDGCLKGLGQQVWSMGVNILDALLGLLLTWQLLPRHALAAYIGILYATEIFNFALSIGRLLRCLPPPCAADGAHPRGGGSGKCAYRAGRSEASPPRP